MKKKKTRKKRGWKWPEVEADNGRLQSLSATATLSPARRTNRHCRRPRLGRRPRHSWWRPQPRRRGRAPSDASVGRRGGCRSCRSPGPDSRTACPLCAHACVSYDRWSWRSDDHSPRPHTQTAFHLKKLRIYKSAYR